MTSGRFPNATLGEAIRQARYILINFEGPICTKIAGSPTPYIQDVLAACHESGRFTAVISSASADIIHAYLDAHDLASKITAVATPAKAGPANLPPDPDLIGQAAQSLDAPLSECVVIASTPSTIQAARTAGVPAIGYARTRDYADHLAATGSNVLIYSMADLVS